MRIIHHEKIRPISPKKAQTFGKGCNFENRPFSENHLFSENHPLGLIAVSGENFSNEAVKTADMPIAEKYAHNSVS